MEQTEIINRSKEDLETIINVMASYCKGVIEALEQPRYTLTALKLKRIHQMMENALRFKETM